jgi:hypothetical protein
MDDHNIGPQTRQFLLLFYWDGEPPGLDEGRVRERADLFVAWARTLETRGELVAMEALAEGDDGTWLAGAAGAEMDPDARARHRLRLDRACVMRARDRAAALESARQAPHLEHGGIVVVQEIDHG